MIADSEALFARLAIRELIENWVMWRDAGDWDRFSTLWHRDGRMVATWFQASAADFIERTRIAWEKGMRVAHILGGTTIDLAGDRATSETRMQIIQRAQVHGIDVEVNCLGRFLDTFVREEAGWQLVLRQVAYEMDKMTPIDTSATLRLDPKILSLFPEGYKHLGYLQTVQGFDVARTLPGLKGPGIDAVRAGARRWLAGETAT